MVNEHRQRPAKGDRVPVAYSVPTAVALRLGRTRAPQNLGLPRDIRSAGPSRPHAEIPPFRSDSRERVATAQGGARGFVSGRKAKPDVNAPEGAEMHVIGYVRVSTEEQANSGLGVEAQEAVLREACERRGWTYELAHDLGCSGKLVNPALRESLTRLAGGRADALVVAKMDRLARSVVHASDILNLARTQEWNLVVLDLGVDMSTPQGRAMAQMLAVFAELEREMIAARTREALAARKARGQHIGRPRLATTDVVRRILEERAAGKSFARIASVLTDEGVLSPAGRPKWQPSTVRRIFNATQEAA